MLETDRIAEELTRIPGLAVTDRIVPADSIPFESAAGPTRKLSTLTEDDVRRIVREVIREEMGRLNSLRGS